MRWWGQWRLSRLHERAHRLDACAGSERALICVAVALVAVASRAALTPVVGARLPFITVYPGVLIAALLCGFRQGLLALAVMTPLMIYFFLEPTGSLALTGHGLVDSMLSIGVAVLIAWVAGSHRDLRLKMRGLLCGAESLAHSLRDSQERFRCTLEYSPEAIIVAYQGRIVYANPSAAALARLDSAADLLGLSPFDLVHPESLELVRARMHRALTMHQPNPPAEVRVRRPDGTDFEGELWSAPLPWDGGTGIEAILRDISDRKRVERALAQSNADLADFAHVVSHDLKEPLRGMADYAQRVKNECGEAPGEVRDKLDTLVRLSNRMTELVNSLLEYSRVGQAELRLQAADLNEVVRDATEALGSLIRREGAAVTVQSPLPSVRCDRVGAGRVFSNLVSNAIKYNTSSPKRVEIGWRHEHGGPVFMVRDNGIGIPARQHAAVFQMFRRLHPRDRYGGGTGAGLAIVKKIVERHGGRIWLESEPGRGTAVFFTLGPPPEGAGPPAAEVAARTLAGQGEPAR